ncbi:hypothetical protein ALC57_17369 [Trachymyrmex cornetzi]|uniref:DUF7044 domain-containing protein n=1 Tax=Trachymyrmex cornetzi TaxID=471704 RepID=A0A195DD54_9HYME|nr:hypothetical protein ALC57_17369 [Trachymyrmex cornetzi]
MNRNRRVVSGGKRHLSQPDSGAALRRDARHRRRPSVATRRNEYISLVRRQGAEACEHVSTCRTAEDKDRSRERAFVSWVKAKGRNRGERARERNLLDCLMEARWRQPGVVVKVVDVESATFPNVRPVSEIKSTDGLSAARMSNDKKYEYSVDTFPILTGEEAKKKEKIRQRDRLRYKELNKAERCTFPEEWYGRWFQSGITDLVTVNGSEITSKGFCIEKNGDKFLVHDTHYYHRSSSGKVRGKYKRRYLDKYLFENFKYTHSKILNRYFKIKVSKFLNPRTILDSKTLWDIGTSKVELRVILHLVPI